jgi:hypothetical protein
MKKLELIKTLCAGWANQMYSRFGYPVYLVGSSLHSENPRDVDIRIMLPDEVFEARYGDVYDWMAEGYRPVWGETRQKWARDMGKLSMEATLCIRQNIDFQVYPEGMSGVFEGKERLRLDTIKEIK